MRAVLFSMRSTYRVIRALQTNAIVYSQNCAHNFETIIPTNWGHCWIDALMLYLVHIVTKMLGSSKNYSSVKFVCMGV